MLNFTPFLKKKFCLKMPSNLKKRVMIAIIDGNEEIESIMISNILR